MIIKKFLKNPYLVFTSTPINGNIDMYIIILSSRVRIYSRLLEVNVFEHQSDFDGRFDPAARQKLLLTENEIIFED